ncbi:MAG TPA: hydroxymethylglutaryl-CoA reductase, degradative [Polyangia bacterium]|jgi:hydroxymethylglutaryl-CoA reductase
MSPTSKEETLANGSRIPGFYRLSVAERRQVLCLRTDVSEEDLATWEGGGLDTSTANEVVENVVGVYALPLGVALNFRVNGQDFLVPMAVEEPSVIAAASNAAKMVRAGGGFSADADPPVMTAQIEIVGVGDPNAARARVEAAAEELLGLAHAALPRLAARGGGARALEVRALPGRVIVHVHIDCRDAMGANMVNTVAEALAERVAGLARGRGGLRILTNLCDRRCVRVRARVPAAVLATAQMDGEAVRDGIVAASSFAEDDPYRAATHNKGIMNGVDAVVIATGNDWRGVEAGAHAFAATSGRYRPLATWRQDSGAAGDLVGTLEMPMAVGTVGGTLLAHAGARLAQRLLGVTSATTLGMVIGAAGLASNLAALRALATEGIQRGHMALHKRSVAAAERAAAARAVAERAAAKRATRPKPNRPGVLKGTAP